MEQAGRGADLLSGWSAWQRLPLTPAVSPAVLAELLDGGQSFRWHRHSHGIWEGAWFTHRVRVRHADGLEWSAPAARVADSAPAVLDYFGTGTDWREASDQLPWRSDAHLARAMAAYPGLRILRQPFGEALLCFLCSAAKQIVQIKQIAAALSEPRGRLPTWPELHNLSEPALRACKLGFRARYIRQTAAFLAERAGWLEETAALPYEKAKERLLQLPGVGEKVADCVLLFGAGRLEAFPVDVWIITAMSRRYGLKGWKPAQIAHFGRTHFGAGAGLAQQYLFAWERNHGREA